MNSFRTWPAISLPIAFLVVLSPFLFFGYSVAQGDFAVDFSETYLGLNVVPVADPAHSSLLSEPYLPELKRNLMHGRIPLLNMKNGLGAVTVESLLDSTFYILNPILFLLPTDKPLYYDLFQLLHVAILLCGLYFLLRQYGSSFSAAAVAIFVTFSGVTYIWINLDIYRNFAWAPWMMLGAVQIARGVRIRRNAWLLAFAIVASTTAGNLLETSMDVFATCIVFACELTSRRGPVLKILRIFLLSAAGGFLVSMIAVLPYLFSMASYNLFVSNFSDRSIQPYEPLWIFSVMIPRVIGYYPYLFIRNQPYVPHADLSATVCFLILAGVVLGLFAKNHVRRNQTLVLSAVIPVVMFVGYLKIINFSPFRFVAHIPFVSSIAFVKYYSYLYLLGAILMAIGLESLATLERAKRFRLVLAFSFVVISCLLLIVADLSHRRDYFQAQNIPQVISHAAHVVWAVSTIVWLSVAGLIWRQPRGWRQAVIALGILQGLALLPPGFGKRRDRFQAAVPSRYAEQLRGKRNLLKVRPNENLYMGEESVGLYDGVMNVRYKDFMNTFFKVANGYCIFDVVDTPLTPVQVQALQLVGASGIQGYRVAENAGLTRALGKAPDHIVLNPLPELYAVRRETFDRLGKVPLNSDSIADALTTIRQDLVSIPQPSIVSVDGTTFRVRMPANASGMLILNQAYSTYWKLADTPGDSFLRLFPAWQVSAVKTDYAVIHYWPIGLTYGLWLLLPAAGVLFAMDRVAHRESASAVLISAAFRPAQVHDSIA